jgi:hypothetical protein
MTRDRELLPNGTYLVSSYIVRTEPDLRDEETQKMLEDILKKAADKFNFVFCEVKILKNAFSMHVTPKLGEGLKLPVIMQWIKSVFAKAWNFLHGMKGTFWADRYDSVLVYDEKISIKRIWKHLHEYFKFYTRELRRNLLRLTQQFNIKKTPPQTRPFSLLSIDIRQQTLI